MDDDKHPLAPPEIGSWHVVAQLTYVIVLIAGVWLVKEGVTWLYVAIVGRGS